MFSRRVMIFDVYGTIINQKPGLKPAPNQAFINTFKHFDIPITENIEHLIDKYMGHSKIEHLSLILNDISMTEIRNFLCYKYGYKYGYNYIKELYRELEKQQYELLCIPEYVQLVPNFNETMNILQSKGVQYICLTTGFTKMMMLPILNHLYKQKFKPSYYIASDMVRKARPHPDGINAICKFTGYNANDCVKIGDTEIDIYEGISANCLTIGIDNNSQNKNKLINAGANYVINDISELINLVMPYET